MMKRFLLLFTMVLLMVACAKEKKTTASDSDNVEADLTIEEKIVSDTSAVLIDSNVTEVQQVEPMLETSQQKKEEKLSKEKKKSVKVKKEASASTLTPVKEQPALKETPLPKKDIKEESSLSTEDKTTLPKEKRGLARGLVIDSKTGEPLPGIAIYLQNERKTVVTDRDGFFEIEVLNEGAETFAISNPQFEPYSRKELLANGALVDLGRVAITRLDNTPKGDRLAEQKQLRRDDAVMVLDDAQLSEEGSNEQGASYLTGASDDVYLNTAGFAFSPMRFRVRGYNQEYESTYINGVGFNDLERGRFNYSMLGGLNDAMRNKELISGLEVSDFAYGNVGGATNIDTRASKYAVGTKASVAYTNRAYKLRAQVTHSTGLMANGWAFTASAIMRWADQGIIDGTFYNSFGYFLSAEKIFENGHSLSLTTFGAPTKRAQQGAVTQEVYDLAGSIYYNPYWGYQNGEKRNSRVVKSYDPTAILGHEWKINDRSRLKSGIGIHSSNYSNSALTFYNSPDPRPDYYRNLPSFITSNDELKQEITDMWHAKDPTVTQVDWAQMYHANYQNNVLAPNSSSKYAVERRHNNLFETTFNSHYLNQLTSKNKLSAGVEAKYSKGSHYKTMDDLLGGNQWIDIDQFSERDFADNKDIIQNDLRNPNRIVKDGDVFGYNYNIHIISASAYIHDEITTKYIDAYAAAKVTYTQFSREGLMQNGRAPQNSYGKGNAWFFTDPSIKAGITYKIDGHNWISANGLAEKKAPLPSNSYVSVRIKDTRVPYLQSEKVYSYDIGYNFNYPIVRGRISAFQTHVLGSSELTGFYHDEYRTFVNHVITNVDKIYRGVEFGAKVRINNSFSLSAVGTLADYRYTSDANGIMSAESGIDLNTGMLPPPGTNVDIREKVLTKDLMINAGPQIAASLELDYFHPKMWFADISLNYYDKNYLDFAPFRYTESNMKGYNEDQKAVLGIQERLKGGFMLNASVGKVIYFNGRAQSLNINLSANNLLNNTKMITGGYEQARIDKVDGAIGNIYKFPSKYYYAWGFNMFLNVGYKF